MLCAAVSLLVVPRPLSALEVEQVLWGFDGQAVQGRFNPLSVEFSNPTGQPFDGAVSLRRSSGGIGARSGAEIVQAVYVGPFERSRWVQFYAYVPNAWEEWSLQWRGGRYELPRPAQREREGPARVLLYDPDAPLRRSGSMKQFPDHLFPPLVTATDTLETAVLGHAPRWQEPRARAFRDWLSRGGTLHLVTDAGGRFPEFTDLLADLNNPAERFAVGRGYVFRHQQSAGRIDAQFIKAAIEPALNPALGQGETSAVEGGGADAELDAAARELQRRQLATSEDYVHSFYEEGFVETAFTQLKEMTRPDHNWPLIYLLALAYIACVFPGCYVLGRRRIDYRLVYGSLLAVVAVFSVVFALVGRRGYGEATAVNTVAVAKALPDGQWDVTGWSNAFVTSGDTYRIAHAGTGVLYSTAQVHEAVAGTIVNGPGAEFVVDIPAFSSRTFVYRTKLPLPEAGVQVIEWDPAGSGQITLALRGPLAAVEPALPPYAIYGDRFCPLILTDDRQLVLRVDTGMPLSAHAETLLADGRQTQTWFSDFDQRIPSEQRYRNLQPPLIVRGLALGRPGELKTYRLPLDRLRLFIFAPLPQELLIDNPALGRQAGQVVFTVDVFQPEGAVNRNDE
ncbi:MAG TPA: hypothetical protein VML55_19900 [Planctomycetaceae bacterium]|nr:hypothetical protein [Planctomycetaceae bacterium]